MNNNSKLDGVLYNLLSKFSADVGIIHLLENNMLNMVAHTDNIPVFLVQAVTTIPVGKGIAGTTALKKTPTIIKNLSGDVPKFVMPGARTVGLGGCVCVPIFENEKLIGTASIACNVEREFSAEEIDELMEIVSKNDIVELIRNAK